MLLLEGGNVRASWPGIDFVAGVRFCDSRMGWEAEMDSRGTDRCLFCRPALHPRQSGCEPWDGQQRALLARGPEPMLGASWACLGASRRETTQVSFGSAPGGCHGIVVESSQRTRPWPAGCMIEPLGEAG